MPEITQQKLAHDNAYGYVGEAYVINTHASSTSNIKPRLVKFTEKGVMAGEDVFSKRFFLRVNRVISPEELEEHNSSGSKWSK